MIKALKKFIKEYRLYHLACNILKLSRKLRRMEEARGYWLGAGNIKEPTAKELALGEKLYRLWQELEKG